LARVADQPGVQQALLRVVASVANPVEAGAAVVAQAASPALVQRTDARRRRRPNGRRRRHVVEQNERVPAVSCTDTAASGV